VLSIVLIKQQQCHTTLEANQTLNPVPCAWTGKIISRCGFQSL